MEASGVNVWLNVEDTCNEVKNHEHTSLQIIATQSWKHVVINGQQTKTCNEMETR